MFFALNTHKEGKKNDVGRGIWTYAVAVGEGSGASCVTPVLHLESVG